MPGLPAVVKEEAFGKNETSDKPPAPIQAEVLVYAGESCIAKYSITHGDYVVGRDVGCQLLLDVD